MIGSLSDVLAGLSEDQKDAVRRFRLQRSRVHNPRPSTANPDLTQREIQVLARIAEGDNNTQAGLVLHIGRETVKSHMKNVLLKLDAHTRAQAVAIGFRRGCLR